MMKEKNLIKRITNINKTQIGWIIIWVMTLLLSLVSDIEGKKEGGFLNSNIVQIVLLIYLSMSYYRKYTLIKGVKSKGTSPEYILSPNTKLGNIMRAHSIDVYGFFACLAGKLLIFQVILALFYVITFVIYKKPINLIMAALSIIIPLIVAYIYREVFRKRLETRVDDMAYQGFDMILGIIRFIGLIIVIIIFLFISMLLSGILLDSMMPELGSDSIPLRIAYSGSIMMYIMVLISVIWIIVMMETNILFSWLSDKIITFIRYGISGLLLISMIIYIAFAYNNYIVIEENQFRVKENGSFKSYSIEDVDSMDIYEEDGSIQIRLKFSDASSKELFTGSASDTDAWTNIYYSDYNYGADLAKRLNDMGAKISLKDEEALRDSVKSLDQECRDGLEELLEIVK
ncbi:MAG: hypothetical protein K6B41_01455 [Butyrivibrio sp.]|nr:hypothetical protein [Butyrivibrio sp.]